MRDPEVGLGGFVIPKRIVAAALGGVITSLVMTPLDVVKIRMQSASRTNSCFLYCNGLIDHLCACSNNYLAAESKSRVWFRRPLSSTSFWSRSPICRHPEGISYCIYHSGLKRHPFIQSINYMSMTSRETLASIVRSEGVLSLWSGLSPTLVMALPQTVIYFSLNDLLKCHINRTLNAYEYSTDINDPILHMVPPLVGAISRIFSVFTISPLELMRTKMQSKPMTLKTFYDTAKSTVLTDGLRSLWIGVGPTLLRDVPFSAIFWYTFDRNKERYYRNRISASPYGETPVNINFSVAFFYGAMAGFAAGLATHPFDVIKTHRQLELGESLFGKKSYSNSTWSALRRLYSQKGLRGLYSGFTPRLLKTTTASALMVSIFEVVKQNLMSD
nr:solute carrier family 25 0 [Hymenolepis microstoma]